MIALVVDPALSVVGFSGEECGRMIFGFKSDIDRLDNVWPGGYGGPGD